MKKGILQRLLPHSIAIVIFLVVAAIYCKPVFDGKVLQQNDVTQWRAMAQNSFKYKETHGHFPLWTNGMFSGMPAYQIAMESQNAISPGIFYSILTLGLPKPISLFFLACISFYFLSQVVKVNPYIGIIGALAFAYATYNPVIVAAGHDTKMQTIALMPAFIGSLLLVYDKRYWAGGALTALFSSLLVGMNHPQIAYYTFLIAIAMTIAFAINWVRQKEVKHLLISGAIVIVAGLIGVLSNAVTLFTTYEYAKESIRGGSELADNKTNSTKTGLSADYALSYSFAKAEPFVMMVPNMFGGSTAPIEEKLETSKAMESLQAMPPELGNQIAGFRLAYWGGIVESAGTSGPPYVGAIICFLTLLGFFILDNKHKWWILAISALAIMMSWGHYFAGFNHFLLKSLPMYNKFRAPSMTLVIPAFLFCLMSILTLQAIVSMEDKEELWKRFKKGLLLGGGVILLLLMLYFTSDFRSESDRQLLTQSAGAPEQVKGYITDFTNALRDDRQSLFFSSLMRSFLLMAATAFILWLSIRRKIKAPVVFALVGILAFIDIMSVSSKYLNSDNYQDEIENQNSFTQTAADSQILQDSSYYRVLDLRQGLGTLTYGANTAFFHKSIGGYHPAKLSIYQDLIEKQLMQFPQSLPVVNMLNTKYIIQADQSGKEQVYPNPDALGAAWFVKTVRYESTPAAVMNALSNFHPKDTAILFAADRNLVTTVPAADSSATIRLIRNDNDEVLYQATTATGGFAVFSEVFYSKGWKAFIDGKEAPILRTNYVLRGLSIPAGNHEVRFSFHPDSYYTGDTVSLIAGLLVFAALIIALVMTFKKKNATPA
jgi:hypothetical protein